MGNLKNGWTRGTLIVMMATGFLFAGILVSNYFQAKAASEPSKHKKNELTKHPTSETIVRETKDLKQEKERMQKQQNKALFWRNKLERETSKVPESTPTEIVAAQPTTTETATPQQQQTKESNAQPEQQTTQPGTSSKKTVYLTFDDGPSAFSGEIIALLEQYHYNATFFMIDGNIRKYPDAVKLMVQSGETVGLHSVTHNQKLFYASANSVMTELTQNRTTLKEISGVDSYIMRTPYGSAPNMTDEYKKVVNDNGYHMWDWNIDSKDWYYKDERYVSSVMEQITLKANHQGPLVILLHERKETLAHLPALFDYLSKQGFECKPIDSTTTPVQF